MTAGGDKPVRWIRRRSGHGLAFSGGVQQMNAAVAAEAPEAHGSVLATFFATT